MKAENRRDLISSLPLPNNDGWYKKSFKRPMDFIIALIAIIVLSPVLLGIYVLIKAKIGSPVLFKQVRPGLNEKMFKMYKFRTMTNDKNKNGELLPDSVRLTKLGKFLRSASLDELPELFNILMGDMSLVGPRPQLIRDLVFMTEEQRQRHKVMPGLTGWAQINGRNAVMWEERLAMDLEYIRRITFIGDLYIILKTAVKVFKRDGISTEGMETSEDYGDYLLRTGKIDDQTYAREIEKSKKMGI